MFRRSAEGRAHSEHDHRHCHNQAAPGSPRKSLLVSLGLTLGFMVVEAAGGWLTNSLALLSDAGHMLTDAAALGLSLLALKVGDLPATSTKTFGYRRFEVLAALFNGLALWGIVGIIVHEAVERVAAPPDVRAGGMMLVAGVGLGINLLSIRLLHAHKDANLNVRGAFLHVLADCLGSVGALGAGLVVALTGWSLADPLVSLAICGLILWSSWGLVKESVHVLLLGVPGHLDYARVQESILSHDGVCCLYDLHLWSIAPGQDALSAHVVVRDGYTGQRDLLRAIVDDVQERYGIAHATIQLEESHEMKELRADAACRVDGRTGGCLLPALPPKREEV